MTQESRVFVLWWGGSSYAMWTGTNDLESFPDLESARDAIVSRYQNGYWESQDFHYVNKAESSDLCPAVGEDSEMWVFYGDPTQGDGDLYPDTIIRLCAWDSGEVTTFLDQM